MSLIDWIILSAFLIYTIWDGTRDGKKATSVTEYFLAGRSMPWWAMGLSVMATQASAITFIGTTGQAFTQDMRFIQTYLGLPFAMVIISLTLIPFYHKMKNFSAYEVLESRFGLKTRLFTSGLFLISRGLALGTVIAAPSYVLALILNLNLSITILIIGLIATLYTMTGGISGVIRTDVKQMSIMLFGIVFSFGWILHSLSDTISISDAFYLAGSLNKLQTLDFSFSLNNKYTVWSGFIAGLFLMLSYFGTDQSQVQRYLTAKSEMDAQQSLLLSAFAKIPLQFIILLLGVMLYVFFIINPMPVSFRANDDESKSVLTTVEASKAEQDFNQIHRLRKEQALHSVSSRSEKDQQLFIDSDKTLNQVRTSELNRRAEILGKNLNDTNYIFPYFILTYLPIGITGLLISAIFAAAFSSIDSELNALTTCSIIDWYQRLNKKSVSESHYVNASRWTTLFWGILATISAMILGETKSIIEMVNQIGSYFYGSILGVFILLLFFKKVKGNAALIGLITGMTLVFIIDSIWIQSTSNALILKFPFQTLTDDSYKLISFLWLNPVGAVTVVLVGSFVSLIKGDFTDSSTRNESILE